MQLGDLRALDVGLLTVFEDGAARTDVFLAFNDHTGKFAGKFLREKLQNGDAEQQVELDIFFKLSARDAGLQEFAQQLAKLGGISGARLPRLESEELLKRGGLAHEIGEILASDFEESRT